ncbi:hypothetical protein [Arthrobacter sp. C9C5]|uniref:hypothetical protein n=1 Tax=Arthrobacter sp. C9C5 TaxID=2735267 RepID=UPI0015853145|nr:hypothetical protein [Arthrobacter sp. C9C5]NUU30760.1 hypothetical protein [Arthrobacter sp. C9C5]
MDSSKHDLSGGEPYDDEQPAGTGTRRRWPLAAAVVIVALAAVAGGVAVAGNMRPADPAPAAASTAAVSTPTESATVTTAPSPTATASESATPSASATSATSAPATPAPSPGAWRTFTSADARVSFDYPAAWRVSPATGASDSGGVDVDVANEAGVVVASLHFGPSGGIGGACQGAVPYTVLDSVEVNLPYQPSKGSVTPRFAFRALQEADHVTASYGLTSTLAGQGGTTCMFYNVVNGPADPPLYSFADAFQVRVGDTEDDPMRKGAKTFPSMEAARAYMQTPEYLNAKRMITSLKINVG